MKITEIAADLHNKLDDIYAYKYKDYRRHLGASVIGNECMRYSWYVFKWATHVVRPARINRLFGLGHREERALVNDVLFRAVIKGSAVDPATGLQYTFSDFGGHFGGSPDLFMRMYNKKFVGEIKTHKDSSFKQLRQHGVKKAHFNHYIQGSIYAYAFGLNNFMYLAINKDTSELYTEGIKINKKVTKAYFKRAKTIITTDEAPVRLSSIPTFYKCKMCDYHSICHLGKAPDINCRTCLHSTAILTGDDGTWECALGNDDIITKHSKNMFGCKEHVFNPHLLSTCTWKATSKRGIKLILPNKKATWHGNGKKMLCSADLTLILNKHD